VIVTSLLRYFAFADVDAFAVLLACLDRVDDREDETAAVLERVRDTLRVTDALCVKLLVTDLLLVEDRVADREGVAGFDPVRLRDTVREGDEDLDGARLLDAVREGVRVRDTETVAEAVGFSFRETPSLGGAHVASVLLNTPTTASPVPASMLSE
jgi:hypothetical protein